ncbi:helix-turn-helix domain-containing protein [Streptosporangium soli]|nr:helix-turn-helix domain-containing protein [Streptosporangium sp. KLBMP 9127]
MRRRESLGKPVARTSHSEELGQLLREIKERSGRSYEWIGRKANASKSAVHRYCSGDGVPPTFAIIEQIAVACRADREDMVRLHQLWIRAVAGPEVADPLPGVEPAMEMPSKTPQPDGPETTRRESSDSVRDAPTGRARVQWRWRAVTFSSAGVVIACFLMLTASASSTLMVPRGEAQRITGPSWVLPSAPVPGTLFGVTINSATGAMPSFRVGAVRLWDSATRWSQIQQRRGEFDWSTLDRQVEGAERAGLPVLFVFGGTPGWASPGGPPAPYPDGARAAPPDNLADWDAFVRAMVRRYAGRIEAYELWALGNDHRFYTGDVGTLVEMTRRASRIIKAVDPQANVVCPGMGRLWTSDGRGVMRRFAELGGYTSCDVASVKLHQRTASDPPETMLELAALANRVLHAAGVHPRLWSTGTTYTIPLQDPLDAVTARDYAVRYFLVGLYARDLNLERMYFYNWGSTKIPLVLQGEGGVPTAAALAAEQLQRWLAHAHSRSCGHGNAINLPDNVWQCELTISGDRGTTRPAAVIWTITGTAGTTVRQAAEVRRLDGTSRRVRPGDTITVGEEPIFIEYSPERVR